MADEDPAVRALAVSWGVPSLTKVHRLEKSSLHAWGHRRLKRSATDGWRRHERSGRGRSLMAKRGAYSGASQWVLAYMAANPRATAQGVWKAARAEPEDGGAPRPLKSRGAYTSAFWRLGGGTRKPRPHAARAGKKLMGKATETKGRLGAASDGLLLPRLLRELADLAEAVLAGAGARRR